ncbi:MAG: PH domain-containing protein [Bacteroidota bacterium]
MDEVFKASRVKDVFTPDEVILGDKGITFKINKLIGGAESFVFYQDISGVEIDSGLFFATIRVIPRARHEIVIENFSKADAQEIKRLILERV